METLRQLGLLGGSGGRGVEFLCNLTQTCSRTEPHTCYALK